MARLLDDAQSEYLRNANPVLTGVPMTMVAWFKSNDDAINQVLMSIGDNAGDLNIFGLSLRGDIDDKIYASLRSTTQSWLHSISVGTFSTGTWQHAAAVFASATSRTVYLDGVAGTPETTSCTPLGLDATAIGRGERASPFGYMSGSLAEVAIWNAALSPAEIVALAAGEYPDTVRPGNLVAAWHLRDDDLDHVGEFDMTPYNTPSWSTHPPMKQPLAGTCAISSTTAGIIKATRELVGTTVISSTTAGELKATREIVGTSVISSTTSGILGKIVPLAGTSVIGSAITGELSKAGIKELIGTVAIESTTSGALELTQELIGTVVISSTVTGALFAPGGLSDYAGNNLLELITGKTPLAKPTAYIGFCTADPGEGATGADCNEVSNTNGYGRVATTGGDWNSASSGAIANAAAITSPSATGGSWGTITHYVLVDSPTYGEGNVLVYDQLDTSRVIEEDDMLQFAAGELSLSLD